jgi:hypothetical protein
MLSKETTATGIEAMDHNQAVEQMAAERYLLDELTPDAREAFEEHVFDCPDCAMDLRASVAFVDEAKAQLPALTDPLPAPPSTGAIRPKVKRNQWLSWWRPAIAAPAFAALLAVVGYQNLVTFPGLRAEANQPRLLPWIPLHGATRGDGHLSVTADRQHGVALPIDLSQESGGVQFTSYSFELLDAQGKIVWTGNLAAPAESEVGGQRISLAIPGAMLRNGAYTVAVSGIGPREERAPVERYVFDIFLNDSQK